MARPLLSENVERTVTPGGTVVLSERLPHVASASLGFFFRTGSRDEAPGEEGMTHFLEHMFFKGTPRRTGRGIAEELDAVGGHLDAGTSHDYTSLYARVLAEHVPLACDMVSDMLCNSLLSDEEVGRERGVVLDEIRLYEDEPADIVVENLLKAAYGEHPMARPVLGRREVIDGLDHRGLEAFRRRRYASDRLVVAVAGLVEHGEVLRLLAPLLSGLPARGVPREGPSPVHSPRCRLVIRGQEQAHFALAAPALKATDERYYIMLVLNNLLGGSYSSRLFQEVREKRGLAYSIGSSVDSFADGGLLVIQTACEPGKFGQTAGVIGRVLAELASGGVTDEEVIRNRNQLKGATFLGMEGTSTRMMRLAMGTLYLDRVVPLAEVMEKVDAVTPGAVRELAAGLLGPGRFASSVLAPGDPAAYRVPWLAEPVAC